MIKKGLIATLIAALVMGGMSWWAMNALPATGEVPVHWNYKGEADRYAPVSEAKWLLWLVPGLSVFTSLVFALGIKIDPRNKNIMRSRRAYMAIWMTMLVLMTLITALISYSMVQGANLSNAQMENMPAFIVGVISILFLILGNYLPKSRSNWFFGIRTPWTLSSDEAWEKTHRAVGRLFVGLGLAGLLAAFFLPTAWQLPIIIGGSLLITTFSLIYSYLTWRNASDRTPTPDYVE